jgi:hypothetical protein
MAVICDPCHIFLTAAKKDFLQAKKNPGSELTGFFINSVKLNYLTGAGAGAGIGAGIGAP